MKVSIIVPVYNVENYLQRCLDSILNQTYKDFEVLLVNDASTDRSGEICAEYARKDKRIRYICKTENAGVSSARNDALRMVRGGYIAFVDSDDYVKEFFLETLIAYAEQNDVDIVAFNLMRIGKFHRSVSTLQAGIYTRNDFMKQYLTTNMNAFVCNKIFKARLWEGIFFAGEKYEDMRVFHQLIDRTSKCQIVSDALYFAEQRTGSLSRSLTIEMDQIYAAELVKEYVCKYYPALKGNVYQFYMHFIANQMNKGICYHPIKWHKELTELNAKLRNEYLIAKKQCADFDFDKINMDNLYTLVYTKVIKNPVGFIVF